MEWGNQGIDEKGSVLTHHLGYLQNALHICLYSDGTSLSTCMQQRALVSRLPVATALSVLSPVPRCMKENFVWSFEKTLSLLPWGDNHHGWPTHQHIPEPPFGSLAILLLIGSAVPLSSAFCWNLGWCLKAVDCASGHWICEGRHNSVPNCNFQVSAISKSWRVVWHKCSVTVPLSAVYI